MKKTELEQIFKKYKLVRIWDLVEPKLTNSIHIHPKLADEKSINIGASKIGGSPDLPRDIMWFEFNQKPMSFLAQINLSEVFEFDIDNKLPANGILYFFYDADQDVWGFDPKDKDGSKVFYDDGNISQLERKEKPNNLDEDSYFNSCSLSFTS